LKDILSLLFYNLWIRNGVKTVFLHFVLLLNISILPIHYFLITKFILGTSFKNGNDEKLKSFFVLTTQIKTASETVKLYHL